MSPRAIRRAAERQAAKLAAKATKVMTASVGSVNDDANELNSPIVDIEPREPRPISEAKLLANRQNAKLCTGAKTEAGHKASSMNALRHGLTAKCAVLPGDDAVAYEELVASHVDRYSPATDEEHELVHSIADNAWRILKVPSLEEGMYEVGRIEHGETLFMQEKDPFRRATLITAAISMLYTKHLKNLQLQERRVRNQHKADIAKLKEIQTERIEKPQREAKQDAEDNKVLIDRFAKCVQTCTTENLPFDPAQFGFDFTLEEWQHFRPLQLRHHRISGEYLDLKKVIAAYRAA